MLPRDRRPIESPVETGNSVRIESIRRGVTPHRLVWVGPATVAIAVLAVRIVQKFSLAILGPIPPFSAAVLESNEPVIVTAVLVAAAVLVFAALANASVTPVRTFKRLALVVLLVSFVPNLAMAVSGAGWPPMIALMAMHVAAWSVTVTMLTRLSVGGPIQR